MTSIHKKRGRMSKHMLWHPPVVVKDLKAIDIQHTNYSVFPMQHWVVVFHLSDAVDAADDPAEKPFIESL